jgi:hypothetical protein
MKSLHVQIPPPPPSLPDHVRQNIPQPELTFTRPSTSCTNRNSVISVAKSVVCNRRFSFNAQTNNSDFQINHNEGDSSTPSLITNRELSNKPIFNYLTSTNRLNEIQDECSLLESFSPENILPNNQIDVDIIKEKVSSPPLQPLPLIPTAISAGRSHTGWISGYTKENVANQPKLEGQKTIKLKTEIDFKKLTVIENDIINILEGSRMLKCNQCAPMFNILGCITSAEYGFVLKAEKVGSNSKKKDLVYLKMINRNSNSYKFVQQCVNPMHTELALLQTRKALHLPEYITHYWEDDYLIIVTYNHGLQKKTWNPFLKFYHNVFWIYYFSQIC